jgi:hypothetical protein
MMLETRMRVHTAASTTITADEQWWYQRTRASRAIVFSTPL